MAQMILNIRPAIDSQRDAVTLSRRGVASACLPVMEIVTLAPQLPNALEIAGLVFTSRHAVLAFVDAMDTTDWWKMPVFAVGQATAAAARVAGFVCIFTGSGVVTGLYQPFCNMFQCVRSAFSGLQLSIRVLIWHQRSLSMDMMSRRSTSMSLSRG